MSDPLPEFAAAVFDALARMDTAASTMVRGHRAGLCDFAGHLGITTKTYEVPIYRALAKNLDGSGFAAVSDQRYPGGTQSCDVLVTLPDARKLWMEVKQAWKCWFSNRSGQVEKSGFYTSYLLGPRAGGLARTHSAGQDFEKIEQLRPPHADCLAFLLIGFEAAADSMDAEILRLEKLNDLSPRGWRRFDGPIIPDSNAPACRIRMWLWCRPA